MAKTSPKVRATLAAATLAAAAVTGVTLAATAGATESNDSRAVAHDGNATTCEDAGLPGERVAVVGDEQDDVSNIDHEDGAINSDRSVTITALADGLTATGFVIKGGDAYNVYTVGELGVTATPPWEDLVAPINDGGNEPQLSHWYVCAEGEVEEPEPTTTTTTPDDCESAPKDCETTTPPESSTPDEPTTTVPDDCETNPDGEGCETTPPGDEPSTTTEDTTETTPAGEDTETPAPGAENDDDDLALTGFDAGWLIPVGLLLLLGGGAVLWLARARRNLA